MSEDNNVFNESIALAKQALKNGEYELAEAEIKKAMHENPHSPAVHNLYGIFEELQKDDDLAHRHYRAAYALDPSYRPAIKNLERISTLEEHARKAPIDFGDQPEVEEESLYEIEYDKKHVGHLRKKDRR